MSIELPGLPAGWRKTRVDRVATVNARIGWKALTAAEYQSDGYAFLSTPNIKGREIDFDNVNYITEFRYRESQELQLALGDVLLAKDGNTLGIVNVVHELPRPATVNGSIAVIRPTKINSSYLRYVLDSSVIQESISSLKGGMGVPHLFQWDINRLPIPLPPLEEQRRIAAFLDAETARLDRLTNLRKRQVSLIGERYAVAISEYTTPGISSACNRSEQWPWLPENLQVARLGYFARVQTGVTVHGARATSPDDAEYPYLRVANVQDGIIDLGEVKTLTVPNMMAAQATLRSGDVVITEANGNPDNLGRGAVWRGEIPGMIHQNHVFAIRADTQKLDPDYLAALLASTHGRRYFRLTASQVGIATTSGSKVLNFPIPLVSLDKQKQVAERCKLARHVTDKAVEALQRQSELLIERRQALITAAVTGQIDVSTASGRGIED